MTVSTEDYYYSRGKEEGTHNTGFRELDKEFYHPKIRAAWANGYADGLGSSPWCQQELFPCDTGQSATSSVE